MATTIVRKCDDCGSINGIIWTFYMSRDGSITMDAGVQYTEDIKEIDLCEKCICSYIETVIKHQKKFY